jgi:hypothetical protein
MPAASPTTSVRSKLRGRPLALAAGTRPGRMLATLLWLRTRADRKGDAPAVEMIDACLDGDPRAQLRMVVGADVSLKPRQWDVLDLVWRGVTERGVCPTYREMGEALGWSAATSVYEVVEELVAMGVVEKDEQRSSRALRIVPAEERISR